VIGLAVATGYSIGTMRPSDANDLSLCALMRSVQAGDKHAYETLLRASEPIIRRAASRAGVRGAAIEDVVQETLLTLHKARQTYDPSRSYTAWLTVIAQRRGIDALRRAGRGASREVHAPIAYEQHADTGAAPDRPLADADLGRELKAAIDTLTPGQREAVELLALQENSLAEASLATGKTTGALKVNLHRALKALRERLAGEDKFHV
jgi:RNA polymerase sigma factor (sigma-70 family)